MPRRLLLRALIGFLSVPLFLAHSVYAGVDIQSPTTAPARTADPEDFIEGNYWALIIGINKYPTMAKDKQLEAARWDAEAVAKLLVDRYGFSKERMMELYDEAANRRGIIRAFSSLKHRLTDKDSLFIYYAGRGGYDEDVGYWIPSDAALDDPSRYIFNTQVRDYMANMPARHIYAVVDSAFSGSLMARTRALGLSREAIKELYMQPSRWVLASGGLYPVPDVADKGKNGHSTFAWHFMKLLERNTQPYLLAKDIAEPIAIRVSNEVPGQLPRSAPVLAAGDEGGQFVFRRKREFQKGPMGVAAAPGDLSPLEAQPKEAQPKQAEEAVKKQQEEFEKKKQALLERLKGLEEQRKREQEDEEQPPTAEVETSEKARKFKKGSKPTETMGAMGKEKKKKEEKKLLKGLPDNEELEITRYPTLESPNEVVSDKEFAVQVSLTEDLITPEVTVIGGATTAGGQLKLSLPDKPALESWKLDVVLSAPGFVIRDGANTASISLPRKGNSTPALFYLRPKAIPGSRQVAKFYATFWHAGAYVAKVARSVTVVSPSEFARSSIPTAPQSEPGEVAKVKSLTATQGKGTSLDLGMRPPDLTVFVLEAPNPAHPSESEIILMSPHFMAPVRDTFPTPTELASWLDLQYDRFAQLGSRGISVVEPEARSSLPLPERTRPLLQGFGRELYRKFIPAAFKDAFWQLKAKLGPRFQAIQIYSNNPVLPWELIRPIRADGSDEQEFLGVNFRVARWHISQGVTQLDRPPQSLPMKQLAVIAPEYPSHLRLPNQEVEVLALRAVKGFQRLPGRLASLAPTLRRLPGGIIHFVGHGVVQQQRNGLFEYSIRLEDSDLDLLTWRGMASSQQGSHPFIFFNACDIGQSHRVANFVDGWAPAVLESGASGYIGGLWPLGDKGAAEFAAHFYKEVDQRLNQGPVAVADLLRDARRLFYEKGDPTFLAYAYYGDPNFQFIREKQ